ncbi:hypothetical protein OG21DRAFT_151966 [Imleria badia]|nr:hypothetical protein OG21DRAFT_151966 [Imleria badia]
MAPFLTQPSSIQLLIELYEDPFWRVGVVSSMDIIMLHSYHEDLHAVLVLFAALVGYTFAFSRALVARDVLLTTASTQNNNFNLSHSRSSDRMGGLATAFFKLGLFSTIISGRLRTTVDVSSFAVPILSAEIGHNEDTDIVTRSIWTIQGRMTGNLFTPND